MRDAKMTYNEALKNLEQISEEIHKMREQRRLSNDTAEIVESVVNVTRPGGHPKLNAVIHLFFLFTQMEPTYLRKPANQINSSDEYLDFPPRLTTKASPIRQHHVSHSDCPHLLRDFMAYPAQSTSFEEPAAVSPNVNGLAWLTKEKPNSKLTFQATITSDDIEQWTEIRLSHSDSTSSGYSQHSIVDDRTPTESSTTSSSGGGGGTNKVTCTTIFSLDDSGDKSRPTSDDDGLTTWITKSNLKSSSRRQSLDILIDAGDRVKDVFTTGFQKVGKSLERRNSESEVSADASDFFLFSR